MSFFFCRPLHPRLSGEKGNALFLILIAVILFAALSYAITQSNRGGGAPTQETASVKAATILSYANDMRDAYTRLNLHNNLALDHVNGITSTSFTDPGGVTPVPPNKQVFSPQGGGLGFIAPYDAAGNTDTVMKAQGWALAYDNSNFVPFWYGEAYIDNVGSGTQPNEVVQIAVKDLSTCQALNQLLIGQSIAPGNNALQAADFFSFNPGHYGGSNCPQCSGQGALCVSALDAANFNPLNGPYILYSVINEH